MRTPLPQEAPIVLSALHGPHWFLQIQGAGPTVTVFPSDKGWVVQYQDKPDDTGRWERTEVEFEQLVDAMAEAEGVARP